MNAKVKSNENSKYLKNPHIKSVTTIDDDGILPANMQVMFTDYTSRKELIENFDFVHCCVSMGFDKDPTISKWIRPSSKLYISRNTYDAIKGKLLVDNKPGVESYREKKFLDRGYKRGWFGAKVVVK